tara:strand:- start:71719 stop:72456 length:738 start_codon:yes stop_codon:yes gene_type:complete
LANVRFFRHQPDDTSAERQKSALPRWSLGAALCSLAIAGVGAAMTAEYSDDNESGIDVPGKSVQADSQPGSDDSGSDTGTSTSNFAIEIRKPPGPPRVGTGLKNVDGTEVTVACSTCHTTRVPNHHNKTVKELDEFHGGMAFSHGTVSCLSCHNERDYDTLRLADGSRVEFPDVMKLCAQCHGPQMKAYEHGAHGGMNGYWDLTRGPQTKNNCIDCHDPHAPQFPKMRPTFKPKDRFLEQPRTRH